MIDEQTRAALIAEGWTPPPITDFEPWRAAVAAYWRFQGMTAQGLLDGDAFDEADKKAAHLLRAAAPLMPPMTDAE